MSFLSKLNRVLKKVDTDIPRSHGSIVILKDQKAYDAHGGTGSTSGWNARNLNTKYGNGDFVTGTFAGTGNSNTAFTIAPGDYYINFYAPMYFPDYGVHRLYNNTTSTVETISCAQYAGSGSDQNVYHDGDTFVQIRGQKNEFQMEYNLQASHGGYDLGFRQNLDSGLPSIFTTVIIRKLA